VSYFAFFWPTLHLHAIYEDLEH